MSFLVAINKGSADEVVVVEKPKTTTEKILEKLPKEFIAIARAESGMNPRAQNWNCRYDGVSKPCLPADRPLAWSVDCGLFQINTEGTHCPESLFDLDINISKALDLYSTRGMQPWKASMHVWIN